MVYSEKPKNIESACCRACFIISLRTVKWFPVTFIVSILLWSYYAFVLQLCLSTLEYLTQQIVYLIVYHILFVMLMWAYIQTIRSKASTVPVWFRLSQGEVERLIQSETQEMQNSILELFSKNLPVLNRTNSGARRYCEKCRHIKPDRSHHCSVCSTCILKMDHHCPWVNNCVCFSNYKFFVLFLGYALVYCLFISVTSIQYFIAFWKKNKSSIREFNIMDGMGRFHILFLFFVAVMFAISLASLFIYHLFLISSNRTTLEAFRPPVFEFGADKMGWNLGAKQNFCEVFGPIPALWLLPVFTTQGDGVSFPVRPGLYGVPSLYSSVGT